MDEPEKSHSCDAPGCNMQFEDESHLVIHRKKHDMVLNLGNGQRNMFSADQTPTPTRFIRNCEELGLFQDLQNVNPFEETFRKAVETGKTGYSALQEVEHLEMAAGSDDTLHTPHVFPYIPEEAPSSTSPVRSIVSSFVASRPRNSVSDEVKVFSLITKSEEVITNDLPPVEFSKIVVRQEADTSQRTKQRSSIEMRLCDGGMKPESSDNVSAMQLLLRMPDGKLVALSNVQTTNAGAHPTVLTFAPAQPHLAPTQVQPENNNADVLLADVPVKSKPVEPTSSSQPAKVSLAKLKLKEVLTKVAKTRTRKSNFADKLQAAKVCIPRRMSDPEISTITDSQPTSTSSTKDAVGAPKDEEAAERKRKFLERNRAAAMRCREKRRTWIQDLEKRSRELESTNQHLQMEVASLRTEVAQLKTLLLAHKDCPVTQALAQGGRVTIASSSSTQQQVISMTLPASEATGSIKLATAAPRKIAPPPSASAALVSTAKPSVRLQRQAGTGRRRGAASSAGITSAAAQPQRSVILEKPAVQSPAVSKSILVPPGPQIISVAGLQPATTYILTAAPAQCVEPLQVIEVNRSAVPTTGPLKMEVDSDSDSDVEVVSEMAVSRCQPGS